MRRPLVAMIAGLALTAAACSDELTKPISHTAPSAPHHAVTAAASGLPAVVAGNWHTCALRVDTTVECWGDNSDGQLNNIPTGMTGFVKLAGSGLHDCGLKNDATLVCWGNNGSGQSTVPAGLGPVADVSAGWSNTCALLQTGYVRCWGSDYNNMVTGPNSFGQPVTSVSVNYTSTCVIAQADGHIACWGANDYGGVNPPAGQYKEVDMAAWGGCALALDSTIHCWGYGIPGWFNPPAGSFTQLSVAQYQACALSPTNDATCWGMSSAGGRSQIAQVSAGGKHACGVTFDAKVQCWGSPDYHSAIEVPPDLGGPLPPTASTGPGPIYGSPGVPVTLTGTCADPANSGSLSCSWMVWELGDVGQEFSGSTVSVTWPYAGTFHPQIRVRNGFGYMRTASTTVVISDNVAPVVNAITGGAVSVAGVYTASGTFTDPSSTSWTATADYGDGTGAQPVTVSGNSLSLSHAYTALGTFTITVTVTDNQGLPGTATTTATVVNVPPVVSALPAAQVTVGSPYTASGSFTDLGSTAWTATVNYGDGSAAANLPLSATKTYALSHTYHTVGTFTTTVTISDNQGAASIATAAVTVQSAAAAAVTVTNQVAALAQSGAITPAAAQSITVALTAANAALAAGNKNAASADLASAGLTIAREVQAGRMTQATATAVGTAILAIAKAIWFP